MRLYIEKIFQDNVFIRDFVTCLAHMKDIRDNGSNITFRHPTTPFERLFQSVRIKQQNILKAITTITPSQLLIKFI
jgi:hypothetical protein